MQMVGVTSETDEVPFNVELVIDANRSFRSVLLEAIDVDPAEKEKRITNG